MWKKVFLITILFYNVGLFGFYLYMNMAKQSMPTCVISFTIVNIGLLLNYYGLLYRKKKS